jgi:hypothetical protein
VVKLHIRFATAFDSLQEIKLLMERNNRTKEIGDERWRSDRAFVDVIGPLPTSKLLTKNYTTKKISLQKCLATSRFS